MATLLECMKDDWRNDQLIATNLQEELARKEDEVMLLRETQLTQRKAMDEMRHTLANNEEKIRSLTLMAAKSPRDKKELPTQDSQLSGQL